MKTRVALLLLMLGALAGCAGLPLAPGCLRLGHNGEFCPLPPTALPALSTTHLVTVNHDGQTQTFLGRLQIDSHNVRLAGLSLFGTELFTLDYDGYHIASHTSEGKLHPDLLLAMLELSLAGAVQLKPQLHNLTLSATNAGNEEVRELRESGQLIARITRTAGPLATARIHIEVSPAGLSLELTPLAAGGMP